MINFKYLTDVSSIEDNIYHRSCRQLKDYLNENNIPINEVSRVHIGNKNYYHLEYNNSAFIERVDELKIKKLLDIENIGLVDFYEHNNMFHIVILIDEKELNDKYMINQNLELDSKRWEIRKLIKDCLNGSCDKPVSEQIYEALRKGDYLK